MKYAFDGNTLTTSRVDKWYWIGIDQGHNPKNITSISYTLWNDGNWIEPGDEYELFYYDRQWITLDTQVATTHHLQFTNVPSNAIFWLRNLTKGEEERIFTYEDGKQYWW